MEQTVRVREAHSNGTATVFLQRESACSGDCHKCSGCGAAKEVMVFEAQNPIGAARGDLVLVEAKSAPVLAAAAVMYMLPLLLFFAGYLAGSLLWERGGLVGCVAFALGIGCSILYDRLKAKKQETVYTITAFAREG